MRSGQLAVADGLGRGDLAQRAPDFTLECGARSGGGDVVDGVDVSGEVAGEARGETEGIVLFGKRVAALAVVDVEQTLAARAS